MFCLPLQSKVFYVRMVRNGMVKLIQIHAKTLAEAKRKFEKANVRQIRHISYEVARSFHDLNLSPFGYDESLTIRKDTEEKHEQMVERMLTLWSVQPKPITIPPTPMPLPQAFSSTASVDSSFDEFAFL